MSTLEELARTPLADLMRLGDEDRPALDAVISRILAERDGLVEGVVSKFQSAL